MAGGDFTYALPPFETTNRIVDELLKCNIKLVCSLPDGWVANLIGSLERDERFIHVPVNREEAAVAMCSGAFLSGTGALALMGASGLMTCIYVITKISYTYMLPSLIFITMRGTIGDYAPHHVSNGLYLTRVMDAISLPYYVVDSEDKIANISRGYKMARAHNRPFVVGFTRDVFKEGS